VRVGTQRREVADHQATTAAQHIHQLASRQQTQPQPTPTRMQDDVVEHQQVGVHHLELDDDGFPERIGFGVEQGRVQVVHRLTVRIKYVEERFAVVDG
jgi:hypothetical protein